MMTCTQQPTPIDRRTFIALVGAILLVFIVSGLVAVFGLYYADERHMNSLNELDRHFKMLNTARAAEVDFKRQVQEWKNILLRGAAPEDLTHYRQTFEDAQNQVQTKLQALLVEGVQADKAATGVLLEEHRHMARRYAEALATFNPAVPADASRVDRLVRGIDRSFTEALDSLVAGINQRVEAMRASSRAEDAARYRTLRHLTMGTNSIGAVLAAVLLLVFLRGRLPR